MSTERLLMEIYIKNYDIFNWLVNDFKEITRQNRFKKFTIK